MKISVCIEKMSITIDSDGPFDPRALPIVGQFMPSLPAAAAKVSAPPAAPLELEHAPPAPDEPERTPREPRQRKVAAPDGTNTHSRKRQFFTSPQLPGKTLSTKQISDLTGVSQEMVRIGVRRGKKIGAYTFTKSDSGHIPDYQEYHGTTRGQADGDMMPINAGRHSASEKATPTDLQRKL